MKPFRFAAVLLGLALSMAPIAGGVALVQAQGFESKDTGLVEAGQKAGFNTQLPCRTEPGGCIPFFIGTAVNALLGIFGALFLVLILWGGLQYMFAQGEPDRIKKAKQTIINAVLGMIIVAASYAIANFVLTTISSATGGGGGTQTGAQTSP
ncbi:hypothetical protein KJZ71_04275 [Patescibacteria group bacterium]|uniref:DUF4190 domain-containing protein n=1 Tax=candidate division WWE3 bacterium TaxID=2053526 RepID=A0A928TUS3_UNCKA|nr:hypothetical protein [candidate division WWE3 bacterium]MCL4732988.1 hypothetical protein [Patescibacteria group bacterium]